LRIRRGVAAGLALGVAATGLVVAAQPAQAGTISVPFVCTTNYLGVDFDNGVVNYNVTITAPGGVNAGDPIVATYDFGQVPIGLPFPLTNVSVSNVGTVTGRLQTTGTPSVSASSTPSATVSVGSVPAYGTVAAAPVAVSLPSSAFMIGNKVELVPETFSMTLVSSDQFGPNGATTTCSPQSTSAFGARVVVLGVPPSNPAEDCIAYEGNLTGGPGCRTQQLLEVSITPGRLVQRIYTNATPASGTGIFDGTAGGGQGTPVINGGPTSVNLGTLTSPRAPTTVTAKLNDVTVTDNRGGTFGWSLSATMLDFSGNAGNSLSRSQLVATPICQPATSADAWDFDAAGRTPIEGFDPTFNAPGQVAGSAAQQFSAPVSLCTKDTADNLITGSSGGVYNVLTTLVLTVPAFQAADKYTSVMTVLLV
jgi:hypothetical protein